MNKEKKVVISNATGKSKALAFFEKFKAEKEAAIKRMEARNSNIAEGVKRSIQAN